MTMFNMGLAPKGNLLREDLFLGSIGATSDTSVEREYVWTKPTGANMIYMFVQGGGTGGGGGFTRASGNAGGGGAGGTGGPAGRFLIPAIFLPNQMLIRPPNGGLGAAANSQGETGTDGQIIYLNQPTTSRITRDLTSRGSNPGAGTAGAGGAAGTAPSIPTTMTTASIIGNAAIYTATNGVAGGAGNATGAGASPTAVNLLFSAGGGGGAGVTAGDAVAVGGTGARPQAAAVIVPAIAQTAGAGGAGLHGQTYFNDPYFGFFATAGNGGNSGGVVAGGRGGDGGWGCGGGGGGAGTTGGAGGNGGPGFVYILAW